MLGTVWFRRARNSRHEEITQEQCDWREGVSEQCDDVTILEEYSLKVRRIRTVRQDITFFRSLETVLEWRKITNILEQVDSRELKRVRQGQEGTFYRRIRTALEQWQGEHSRIMWLEKGNIEEWHIWVKNISVNRREPFRPARQENILQEYSTVLEQCDWGGYSSTSLGVGLQKWWEWMKNILDQFELREFCKSYWGEHFSEKIQELNCRRVWWGEGGRVLRTNVSLWRRS